MTDNKSSQAGLEINNQTINGGSQQFADNLTNQSTVQGDVTVNEANGNINQAKGDIAGRDIHHHVNTTNIFIDFGAWLRDLWPGKKVIKQPEIAEDNPIKGLRAFGFNDAEVFKRLQRDDSLKNCLSVITGADFKFGVLFGESGCGKTSFLQAGLYHRLNNHPEHCCVYIKLSNEEPLTTLLKALKKELSQPADDNVLALVSLPYTLYPLIQSLMRL